MKHIFTISLIFLTSPAVLAQSCRELFDDQCTNNSNKPMSCFEVEMDDEFMERPDDDLIDQIKEKKDEIIKQAQVFGINPRSLVASMIAANTLRPDKGFDGIAKRIYSDVKDHREGMLYGLGKIRNDHYAGLEKYAANYSPRVVDPTTKEVAYRSLTEVKNLIHSGDAEIEYAAAHLKRRQEQYEKAGFSVKDNPSLMATIYSLPTVENRIDRHKKKGTQPKIDLYGVVAKCQEHIIDEILGSDNKDKESVQWTGEKHLLPDDISLDNSERGFNPKANLQNTSGSNSRQSSSGSNSEN